MIHATLLTLLACPSNESDEPDSAVPDSAAPGSASPDDCDTATVRYMDADGDGYGSDASTGDCEGVELTGDCDDGNAGVHPYAGDVCGDGVDDDCSGGDRGCGVYDLAASSVVLDIQGWGSGGRAVAGRGGALDRTRVVLDSSQLVGSMGAIGLVAGVRRADDLLEATWTQTVGLGSVYCWGWEDVRQMGADQQLFAHYYAPYDGQISGIRRFESPWEGDRLDTGADAIWQTDSVTAGLYVGPEAAADGSDRVFVLTAPGPGATYVVTPEASSGALSSVATTQVDGGWLRPAGDLDGDGVNDMLAFRQDGPDWLQGAAYGPIGEGALAFVDLLDREWSVGNEPATVGDLNGDGLADIAQSDSTEVEWGVFERSVLIFSGDAPSGVPGDTAWLTVQNDHCGKYWASEDYAGHTWTSCEVDLRPIGVGDLDGNGTEDLVIQGVYPTADDTTSSAVVLLDGGAGLLEIADGSAPDAIWVDPGVGGEWEPATDDINLLPHDGAFSTDFDGDGALDLFFFGSFDDTAAAPGNYLYGFRGPIE